MSETQDTQTREIGIQGAPAGALLVLAAVGLLLLGTALWLPWSAGSLVPLALGLVLLAAVRWAWRRRAAVVLTPTALVVRRRDAVRTIPLGAVQSVRERWRLFPALSYEIVVQLVPQTGVGRELRFTPHVLADLGGPPSLTEQLRRAAEHAATVGA